MESLIAAVITGLAGVLTKLGLDSRPNRLRRSIEHTLTVIEKAQAIDLPQNVVADLTAVLTAQTSNLLSLEMRRGTRRLDWGGFVVGIFFTVATAFGAWSLSRLGGWYWTFAAVVVAIFSLVLLGASISALVSGPRKKN